MVLAPSRQILGKAVNNNDQPGWPQQPNNQPGITPPEQQGAYPPIPPAPGPGVQPPQFPPTTPQQQGPEPLADTALRYGHLPSPDASQQYGPAPVFMQAPPKTGLPVWGWIAGGVGAVAVIAVAGVMVFNGLSVGSKEPDAIPDPGATKTAAPEESPEQTGEESDRANIFIFENADFTSPPVWSVKEPEGWRVEKVNEGTVNYRNANLQCTFTVHQGIMPPAGGIADEAATEAALASEIDAVKQSVGKPVEVVDQTGSVYVALRDGSGDIEMREAELRFKNGNDADVAYRMAVRATSSSSGLMELALACPAGLQTEEILWWDLTDRVTMVDAA